MDPAPRPINPKTIISSALKKMLKLSKISRAIKVKETTDNGTVKPIIDAKIIAFIMVPLFTLSAFNADPVETSEPS